MYKFSYESMGTHWEVSLQDGHHLARGESCKDLERDIIAMSHEFNQTYSRFIKTSLVWKIAEKAGTYEVPEDFIHMLKLYMDLYEPSGKKLNPLIGFTISDLGYDDVYTLKEKDTVRLTPDLLDTVVLDGAHLTTTLPVLFDFGALGKGYFVDKIVNYLKAKGIEHFLVNGSGDIYYQGPEPIQVGLEDPRDPTKVIGTTSMTNGAMCASGINRRSWGTHHHVIDPLANASLKNEVVATWVVADNATLSDALASCLFFASPESFSAYTFQYVIMNSSGNIKKSPGWTGDFY